MKKDELMKKRIFGALIMALVVTLGIIVVSVITKVSFPPGKIAICAVVAFAVDFAFSFFFGPKRK